MCFARAGDLGLYLCVKPSSLSRARRGPNGSALPAASHECAVDADILSLLDAPIFGEHLIDGLGKTKKSISQLILESFARLCMSRRGSDKRDAPHFGGDTPP